MVSVPLTDHYQEVLGPATTILFGCHSYYLVHSKTELNEEKNFAMLPLEITSFLKHIR